MQKKVTDYIPLCNALVLLLKPLVEVVIHDLKTGTICYIEGTLSKRKVGDPSLLNASDIEEHLDLIVYPKINFNGRLVKSISVLLSDELLLCINCDVSIFEQMQSLSKQLLTTTYRTGPESLFKNDWQERLHHSIHAFLTKNDWHFDCLTQAQKKELVHYLFINNAFHEKNAATYVATALSMGRATIFNYLKEWKKNESNPL